jgi:hypothetical protein
MVWIVGPFLVGYQPNFASSKVAQKVKPIAEITTNKDKVWFLRLGTQSTSGVHLGMLDDVIYVFDRERRVLGGGIGPLHPAYDDLLQMVRPRTRGISRGNPNPIGQQGPFYVRPSGEAIPINLVWRLDPIERGILLERYLSQTVYREYGYIGATQGGYFPLIDFVGDRIVVSLKTVDPTSKTALTRMMDEIDRLFEQWPLLENQAGNYVRANKIILDIRVPIGQEQALRSLVPYGQGYNIDVRITGTGL